MPDFMPHHHGLGQRAGDLAKLAAPVFARALRWPPVDAALGYATMYLNVLHGKGGGAGWDIAAEARVAATCARWSAAGSSPVLFDVGAHSGSWTNAVLAELGGRARVFQFEPATQNIEVLREQVTDDVTLIEAAVSDEAGVAKFFTTEEASDTSSLYARRDSIFQDHAYEVTEVPVVALDDVIKEHNLGRVDFLKMDIEGHELAALRGARRALEAGKIRALSFEFGCGNINSRTFFHDFWDLLTPLGYRIERVCPGGVMLPVKVYYEDLEYFRAVSNYVAVLERP